MIKGDFLGCMYDCYAGFYGATPIETSGECSGACWRGHFCPKGTATPIPCGPGTFLPVNGSQSEESCIPCSPGSFSAALGNPSTCSSCPSGSYSGGLRSTTCTACPKGGYCASEGAASVAMAFTQCPSGTFNPDLGALSVTSCRTS